MKKYILGVLIVLSLVVAPAISQAATIAELQAQIAAIQAQIMALSADPVACIQEGQSLGAVVPGNDHGCCAGLVAQIPANMLGTRGVCVRPHGPLHIKNVSGPVSLRVGENGTWKVDVSAPARAKLTFKASWSLADGSTQGVGTEKSGTLTSFSFSHAFSQAGTYIITFKVTGEGYGDCGLCPTGMACANFCSPREMSDEASLTVQVGGSTATWAPRLDNIVTPSSLILPGSWVKVRGMRLTDKLSIVADQGDLQALYQALQIKVSDNNTRIDFKLDRTMPIGTYDLFVTGNNGKKSNVVKLIVTGEPKIVSIVPAPGKQIMPGVWIKVRGERLTTNVAWYNLAGISGDTIIGGAKANTYPVISARVSDENRRLDFKIDPRETPGTYELGIVGQYGNSNKVAFTILPTSSKPVPTPCPAWVAPAPGWCEGGIIKAGLPRADGCAGHPVCIMPTPTTTSAL